LAGEEVRVLPRLALVAMVAWGGIASAADRPAAPLGIRLQAALERVGASETQAVWVFFRDKAGAPAGAPALTPRALSRRQVRGVGPLVTDADLPVSPSYLEQVARGVTRMRHASRWLNAVSVDATPAQVEALRALPFVARLDLVARFRRPPELPAAPAARASSARRRASAALDYGLSLGQLAQIGVPDLHALGLSGDGTVVAVFDTGFDNLTHEAFASMRILAQYDFVNGDLDVANGADRGEGSHGTSTLSVLGGFAEGMLVGPAFGAAYLLAKTEDTTRETPVEEDHWAAAAEWAEAAGADIISSSLGYLTFDTGFPSYTPAQLNGDTAISTRAADLAAERGVVVVNSAGNQGFDPTHNTLGAPADGQGVIAVGAVDAAGARATFSSVGPSADGRIKPDVAAQGQTVLAASSTTPRAYRYVNGTSFSCPLTAGVAALLLQAHPEATAEQVRDALRASGSQAQAPNNLLGWGIVNGMRAVEILDER
jgi:subtilisin family serine protease